MGQLDRFRGYFSENSIFALTEIFETAKGTRDKQIIKELELELLSVLQQEKSQRITSKSEFGLNAWEISPKGNNHVIVSYDLCAFVNIYGISLILESVLFCEGEIEILNYHWIEDDNIVVFDVHYIVSNAWQKCICHFENTDFFVYFTPIVEDEMW